MPKTTWYYSKTPRNMTVDKTVFDVIQRIDTARPTYGTRRMATAASRKLNIQVNRKKYREYFTS